MSEVPVQLIVAAYKDEKSADEALAILKEARRERLIGIQDAAVIRKDEKGKLHIKETADMRPGKGAGIGALIGGIIGLLGGPAGVVVGAGAGAGVGALVAAPDRGFRDDRLRQIGEGLQPGTSAIVAVVEHRWVAQVEQELQEQAIDVITQQISADIAAQLEQGKEVSYTAVAAEGAVGAQRIAGDEDETEVSGMLVTEEGVATSAAVATKEGVAYEATVATEGGVAYEAGVVTEEGAVVLDEVATDEGAVAAVTVVTPDESAAEEETPEEEAADKAEPGEGEKQEG